MTDIERSLERLVPKSAPPGLRQRVIDSAVEARKNTAMTPVRRAAFAICAVMLGAVFAADSLITQRESASLTARLDGRSFVQTLEDERLLFEEILGVTGDQNAIAARARIANAASFRQDIERRRREALKRLKGWLANEDFEDLN